MAPRRPTTRRSSSPRRKLVWARQAQTPSAAIAANTVILINLLTGFNLAYGADPIGSTVRRIRGFHTFRNSVAAGNSIRVTLGIGVFPQNSTTAAIGPAANQHLDWMFHRVIFFEPVIATEFATLNMMEIDVRAQRKMEELGDDLFLVIANTHTTDAVNYSYSASTLLALP